MLFFSDRNLSKEHKLIILIIDLLNFCTKLKIIRKFHFILMSLSLLILNSVKVFTI